MRDVTDFGRFKRDKEQEARVDKKKKKLESDNDPDLDPEDAFFMNKFSKLTPPEKREDLVLKEVADELYKTVFGKYEPEDFDDEVLEVEKMEEQKVVDKIILSSEFDWLGYPAFYAALYNRAKQLKYI